MRPAVVPLLAALVVVLAGCSGVATDVGGPTATTTPAPVPTTGTAPYPPGIGADGVTRPLAVANAHAAATARAYAFRSNWTVRRTDGTLRERVDMYGRVTADQWRTHIAVAGTEPTILSNRPSRGVFWSDGEELVGKRVVGGVITYQYEPPARYTGGGFFGRLQRPYPYQPLDLLLESVDLRVAERRANGVVLAGAAVVDRGRFDSAVRGREPTNVSYRLVVDATGLVRAQRLTYEATFRGERVTAVRRVRYVAVGNVSVERPSWFERAVEADGGT